MSGRRVGGKPSPEYNIALLGDLGVGKSGEMFHLAIGVILFFFVLFFDVWIFVYNIFS